MKYVPIPIDMLEVGKTLPVDVWSGKGQLLLRKGQFIVSEQHKEKLYAHKASSTSLEAQAWQRAYERMVYEMLRDGVAVEVVARAPMPSEIKERDYVVGEQLKGGWLDLQEVLRGILYQGGLAINPLPRLAGIEKRVLSLLQEDPDEGLFLLFQTLADNSLGYCATHALLCAATSGLTAQKLGMDAVQRHSLLSAALTMNIGMARDQDSLSRQSAVPSAAQRTLIREHPQKSMVILQGFGIDDADQLDIVRWHHDAESGEGLENTLLSRRILAMADVFIAKMAARKTRAALSPLDAAKSICLGTEATSATVGRAMAAAVGFYPPGSYVQLGNGETAVAVQRGARANTPWVISILGKDGVPLVKYVCKDTSAAGNAIAAPVNAEKVRVAVSLDKVRRARAAIPR